MKRRFCFVTEADLTREAVGGVMTELKMLGCLRKFGDVDVIDFHRRKHKSTWLTLLFFCLDIFRSSAEEYKAYFCRGLVPCFLLALMRQLSRKDVKIVYRTVVPFASSEVKFLGYGKLESLVRLSLFRFWERTLLPRLDAIVVPFHEYADDLARAGVKRERIHVIPFFVEGDFFDEPVKKASDETFKLCYVSGFHSYHDLSSLVDAFEIFGKKVTNARLFLVGEGVLRSQIERQVKEKNLGDQIIFSGKLPHSSIPSFLSDMDVFVSLSRTNAISTSLLEAAAAGKAIITGRKEGGSILGQYFRHGKEVYMVNNAAPDIAEVMRRLYSNSKLRLALAVEARHVAMKYFTEQTAIQQLSKLIDEID